MLIFKIFFLFIFIIPIFGTSRHGSFAKYTWSCENDTCTKRLLDFDSKETPVSFNVCKLFCGQSILWPLPASTVIQGPPMFIKFISFDTIYAYDIVDDENTEKVENLMRAAKKLFRERMKKHGLVIQQTADTDDFWVADHIFKYTLNVEEFKIDNGVIHNLSLREQEEAYKLTIRMSEDNIFEISVKIEAYTFYGARHGLETLAQLIVYDEINNSLVVPQYVEIIDYPKFPYRGIMLDTSRNFISVEGIKRTIDIMAANKLNAFHWHLTDTHSFPIQIEKYKLFTEFGSYSPDKIYTEEDIKSIVDYANVRGVRVIPELDAPAHTGQGWQAVPNAGMCYNKAPWGSYCMEPPCGQLNPLKDEVYETLGGLYKEYRRLFQSKIFHMGGDEVSFACWRTSNDIKKWVAHYSNNTISENNENYNELDSVTRKKMFYTVLENEATMKLWSTFQKKALSKLIESVENSDEKKLDVILWTSDLTKYENIKYLKNYDYIIQVWESTLDVDVVMNLIENNFRVILSNHDALYLDCGFGSWVSGGNNWCSPYKTWYKIYNNKFTILDKISKDKHKLILGQEAPLFTETASEGSLDARLWPRCSALAERTWTNPDWGWEEAESRMLYHRERLVFLGAKADAIQPEWCNLNRGGCAHDINI